MPPPAEPWPVRLTLALVRALPPRLVPPAAAALRWLLRPFAGKDLRRLRANVALIHGLPAGTHFSRMFERQVFRHQIRSGLETLRAVVQPGLIRIAGVEPLRREIGAAEAAGLGHILVTAHLGSWELCAFYGRAAATRPLHVLAKPPKVAAARHLLEAVRRRMGVEVLWTDRKSLLRDMLSALKRGESVGYVMDQKPEGRKGPVVAFLGQPTEFVSGPAAMAARTGCAVIAIFCVREGPFGFRLLTETLFPAGHGVTDEGLLTARMAGAIETAIRTYPEQWTWNYKRWRAAPTPP